MQINDIPQHKNFTSKTLQIHFIFFFMLFLVNAGKAKKLNRKCYSN